MILDSTLERCGLICLTCSVNNQANSHILITGHKLNLSAVQCEKFDRVLDLWEVYVEEHTFSIAYV